MGNWLVEDLDVELWVIGQADNTDQVWNIWKTAIDITRFAKVAPLRGKLQSILGKPITD